MTSTTTSINPSNPGKHTAEYVSLKEYVDTRLAAVDKATDLAYKTLERRLEGMNEVRNQLRDQSGTFVNKGEYNVIVDKLEKAIGDLEIDIRSLRESRAELMGKADQKAVNQATFIAIAGLILGLVGLYLNISAHFQLP